MANKQVRMLTSMAGGNFSHAHGEVVSVESTIAMAWIAAGIAENVPTQKAAEADAKKQSERAANAEAENKTLRDKLAELTKANEILEQDKACLSKQVIPADELQSMKAAVAEVSVLHVANKNLSEQVAKAIEENAALTEENGELTAQVQALNAKLSEGKSPSLPLGDTKLTQE